MVGNVERYEIGLDLDNEIRKIQHQTAKEMVEYLRKNTPISNKKRKKGHLADNWTFTEVPKGTGGGFYQFVWGGDSYRAVHLLEKGVASHNQPAQPVLQKAFEIYSKVYVERMQNIDIIATQKKV